MRRQTRLAADTSAEAEAVQLAIYRRMPAWRKIELVEDANRMARRLAMIGLRARHPDESLPKLKRRLFGLVLGEERALAIYGSLDDVR